MLTLLLRLYSLLIHIEGLPGNNDPKDNYVRPASSLAPKYFEVLEQNSHIVYPLLAVLTLVLIIAGILQAWRTQDMDVNTKVEYKRAILMELRRHLHGLDGGELSRVIGLERLKTVKLLEQMQGEGMVISHTSSKRITIWKVRGADNKPDARY